MSVANIVSEPRQRTAKEIDAIVRFDWISERAGVQAARRLESLRQVDQRSWAKLVSPLLEWIPGERMRIDF